MHEAPKLLVEWSSPWEEFRTAIGPAFAHSTTPLAGEAQVGLFPYRGILISWVLEALLLVAVIVLPTKLASMRPYQPPVIPKYDVIYFSPDELPQIEDAGGAEAGRSGRGGGQEAFHRTQTIRVARGNTVRDRVVDAPKLDLPRSDSPVANLLAFKTLPGPPPAEGLSSSSRAPQLTALAVAPSPDVRRDNMRSMPTLNANVVAPTPELQRDRMQAAPAFSDTVVPPTPSNLQRDIDSMRAPGSQQVNVVPPPISAPERNSTFNARLSLPAASVVAPAPSWTHEVAARGPGLGPGELQNQIVPPPVQMSGSSREHHGLGGMGTSEVVAPPVDLGGSLQRQGGGGMGAGSASVVPPAPNTSGTNGAMGSGRGNRGAGLGGPFDVGSIAAPPTSGGSGGGSGVVVSNQPGSKVGVPGGGVGALAMSPAGGAKPGAGGSGGGTGIGRGNGPGSGFDGEGPGAGKAGVGRGSDPAARGGVSPYPGTGGAGSGTNGTPPLAGVAVKGGNNIVTLPSFDAKGSQSPAVPGKSSMPKDEGPGITVVATSRSGGAFNFYGTLKGDKVYTIYIETALGTAVMQIADPASAEHPSADDLEMPRVIHADVPPSLPKARLVIACVLDRSGLLKRPQVLEPGPAVMTSKVLAALNSWKFRPVLRGEQPVEVNAILGFNIDTNDRF